MLTKPSRRKRFSARSSIALVTYKYAVVFHVCTFPLLSIYFILHLRVLTRPAYSRLWRTVFWEQQGLQTFGHRIQITRPQASQPAFDRHFSGLMDEYGAVHAVNLLGSKENEAALTAAYARHIHSARSILGDSIGITNFDFHNAVRLGGHECVFREIRSVCHGRIVGAIVSDSVGRQTSRRCSRQRRQIWVRHGRRADKRDHNGAEGRLPNQLSRLVSISHIDCLSVVVSPYYSV